MSRGAATPRDTVHMATLEEGLAHGNMDRNKPPIPFSLRGGLFLFVEQSKDRNH